MTDPIVKEVREIRAKIAEQCGFDLRKIMDHAEATTRRISGVKLVTKAELRARRSQAKAKPRGGG